MYYSWIFTAREGRAMLDIMLVLQREAYHFLFDPLAIKCLEMKVLFLLFKITSLLMTRRFHISIRVLGQQWQNFFNMSLAIPTHLESTKLRNCRRIFKNMFGCGKSNTDFFLKDSYGILFQCKPHFTLAGICFYI